MVEPKTIAEAEVAQEEVGKPLSLEDRLQAFLPKIRMANELLEAGASSNGGGGVSLIDTNLRRIDDLDDSEDGSSDGGDSVEGGGREIALTYEIGDFDGSAIAQLEEDAEVVGGERKDAEDSCEDSGLVSESAVDKKKRAVENIVGDDDGSANNKKKKLIVEL